MEGVQHGSESKSWINRPCTTQVAALAVAALGGYLVYRQLPDVHSLLGRIKADALEGEIDTLWFALDFSPYRSLIVECLTTRLVLKRFDFCCKAQECAALGSKLWDKNHWLSWLKESPDLLRGDLHHVLSLDPDQARWLRWLRDVSLDDSYWLHADLHVMLHSGEGLEGVAAELADWGLRDSYVRVFRTAKSIVGPEVENWSSHQWFAWLGKTPSHDVHKELLLVKSVGTTIETMAERLEQVSKWPYTLREVIERYNIYLEKGVSMLKDSRAARLEGLYRKSAAL